MKESAWSLLLLLQGMLQSHDTSSMILPLVDGIVGLFSIEQTAAGRMLAAAHTFCKCKDISMCRQCAVWADEFISFEACSREHPANVFKVQTYEVASRVAIDGCAVSVFISDQWVKGLVGSLCLSLAPTPIQSFVADSQVLRKSAHAGTIIPGQ